MRRLKELIEKLSRAGLKLKPSSLKLLGNAKAREQLTPSNLRLLELEGIVKAFCLSCGYVVVQLVDSLIVLGVCLDDTGSTGASLDHRLTQANKHWF